MKKPDHEFYKIKELSDRWIDYEITETDLLKYGLENKLCFCTRINLPEYSESVRYLMITEVFDGDDVPTKSKSIGIEAEGQRWIKTIGVCEFHWVFQDSPEHFDVSAKTMHELYNSDESVVPTFLPKCEKYRNKCTKECEMVLEEHFDNEPNPEHLAHLELNRNDLLVRIDEVRRFENEHLLGHNNEGKGSANSIEQPIDDSMFEHIDEEIKAITVRYENETEIAIQQKGKSKIPVPFEQLRFRGVGQTWNKFIRVLQEPPYYYWKCRLIEGKVSDADRRQLYEVSKRLKKWLERNLKIEFTEEYNLHEKVKGAEPGIYRFKFTIGYSDTISIDESSRDTFRKRFFKLIDDYTKNSDDDKISKITEVASDGFERGFLSKEEVIDALKTASKEKDSWDKMAKEALISRDEQ